jgi:hypothetical protein
MKRLTLVLVLVILATSAGIATEFRQVVAGSADDAKVYGSNLSLTAGDGVIGSTGEYSCDYLARFTNVTIPRSAIVDSAFVVLQSGTGVAGDVCNSLVIAEDTASAAVLSTYADYADRHVTSASAAWPNMVATITLNWYRTPDIADIIAEVVGRGDWNSGGALAVFIRDDNSSSGAFRRFLQYDFGAIRACSLLVYYQTSTPPETSPSRRRRLSVRPESRNNSVSLDGLDTDWAVAFRKEPSCEY